MIFDEKAARSYEDWLKSPTGYYVDSREKKLILDLLAPKEGERLLDVGCKTGNHLFSLRRAGCNVTGLDPSPYMLDIARKKLGNSVDFHSGSLEDLPFSDNEFDIVTLIYCLEFVENPQKTIDEAIRVSRERVFIGFSNKYSLTTAQRKEREIFHSSLHNFGIGKIIGMIKSNLSHTSIKWGSVIFLPLNWYPSATGLEECIPVTKNPFGSFIGLTFPVTYSHMTIQDPLKKALKAGAGGKQRVPGTARGIKE
jgi:ubiquinone/menaquinone biosynthesis C-methylase UbiE